MNDQQARALAQELLDIQQGSPEDAVKLVEGNDPFLTHEEQHQIIDAIWELAGPQE